MKNKYLHIIFFFCLLFVFVRPVKAFSPTLAVLANPEVAIASGVLLAAGVGYLYLTGSPAAGDALIDGAGNYVRKVVNTAKITALTLDMINQGITTAQDVYVEKTNSWVSTQVQGLKDYIFNNETSYPVLNAAPPSVFLSDTSLPGIDLDTLSVGTTFSNPDGSNYLIITGSPAVGSENFKKVTGSSNNYCGAGAPPLICYSYRDAGLPGYYYVHSTTYPGDFFESTAPSPSSSSTVLDDIMLDPSGITSGQFVELDSALTGFSASSPGSFSSVVDSAGTFDPGVISQEEVDQWITDNDQIVANYQNSTCTAQMNACGVFCQGSISTFHCDDSSGSPIVDIPCSCQSGVVTPFVPSLPTNTNISTAPVVGATDSDILSGVQGNTNAINNNLVAGFGDITTAVTTTAATSDNLAATNTASIVDAINDVETAINADNLTPPSLPPAATFDTDIIQPADTDLQPILNAFAMPSSLSDLFVNNLTISGADPVISMSIYGGTVDVDFSDYEIWIDWAGNMIYFVCCVSALFVAFKK